MRHLHGVSARNVNKYVRLEQFTKLCEADVKRLHGMGPKAIDQIRGALAAKGLSFADSTAKEGSVR